LSRSASLIGRNAELARFEKLVAELIAGRGRAVWIEGEPGIGKTALLDAWTSGVEPAGGQLHRAAAHELSQRFPLRVLLEAFDVREDSADNRRAEIATLLRAPVAGVAPVNPVAPASEQLLALVDRLCAVAPVALVIDDLQWADEASLAVAARLARAVSQLPLLLVTACRPAPRRGDLARARRELVQAGAETMTLSPLGSEQAAEMVTDLVGGSPGPRMRRLAARAGGNPLYLREILDALRREQRTVVRDGVAEVGQDDGAGVPASLAAAIADRLGFLSEDTARALRIAALLGPQFTVADLSAVTGQAPMALVAAIEEGLGVGVLAESGLRLAFRHELIRQALAEATPAGVRSVLHLQAAQALIAAGAPLDRIAEQLLAAPDPAGLGNGWVPDWLLEAGPRLVHRAPQTAAELLERTLDALPVDDAAHREQLGGLLVTAAWLDGRDADVKRHARHMVATALDPARRAQASWALAYTHLRHARYDEALATTVAALADLDLDQVWAVRLQALRAQVLANAGQYADAEPVARQALAAAEHLADYFAAGYALFTLTLCTEPLDRLAYDDRALSIIGERADTMDLRLLLINRADTLVALDRLAEAVEAGQEAARLAERVGGRYRRATSRMLLAEVLFDAGRWDDALAELDGTDPDGNPVLHILAEGIRGLIAVHRDDRTGTNRALRAVTDDLTPGQHRGRSHFMVRARALAAERDGNIRRALDILASTVRVPDYHDVGHLWLPELVRWALAVDDAAIAHAVTEEANLCLAATAEPTPSRIAVAEHCHGLLDDDASPVLAAAERLRAAGWVLECGNALEDAAVLLAGHGDLTAARAALQQAVEVYARLGARFDTRRAQARVRPFGLRNGSQRGGVPRRPPATGWAALTGTEIRVAELVAEGRSNPDIAAVLLLSRRTAQAHVSRILAKLGAASRVEIARVVIGEHDRAATAELAETHRREERLRLAGELHDSVSQALFSISLHTRAMQLAAEQRGWDDQDPVVRGLADLRALSQGALAETRELIFQLRPEELHREGLAAALRRHAVAVTARENFPVEVHAPQQRLPLSEQAEEELFRLIREAVHNSVKHARPNRIDIRLQESTEAPGTLVVEVADDGAGFDPTASHQGHLGLQTMRERTGRLGASLSIDSAPGAGCTVRVVLPAALRPSSDADAPGDR
jgi:signal transduction histidine kinase